MSLDPLSALLDVQSGVVSRAQLRGGDIALDDHDVRRMHRRRELVTLHPGVYVNHTGDPTWLQRAWAAVLFAAPAALCHDSALRAADGPGRRGRDDAVIHVAVDRQRRLTVPGGVVLHRLARLDERVQWNTSPPRVRLEEAVIDVAAEAGDAFAAIEVLANAVQSRRSTASRLRSALDARPRIARRAFLAGVLDDIDEGACSVLEHGYLTRVERPHGLPTGARQVRGSARGPVFRDVVYRAFGQIIELDGRLFHDSAARRDADLGRDLAAAVERQGTVRIGWGQVFRDPCRTAHQVGRLLQARGWGGASTACPRCSSSRRLAS